MFNQAIVKLNCTLDLTVKCETGKLNLNDWLINDVLFLQEGFCLTAPRSSPFSAESGHCKFSHCLFLFKSIGIFSKKRSANQQFYNSNLSGIFC